MKSDRQILDSEYNEILLQTVAVIEKSRSMLAVQVRLFSIVATLISDWGPLFYFANRVGKDQQEAQDVEVPLDACGAWGE